MTQKKPNVNLFTTSHPFFEFLRYVWDQDSEFFTQSFQSPSLHTQAYAYNLLWSTLAEYTSPPNKSPFPYPGNVKRDPAKLPYTPYSFLEVIAHPTPNNELSPELQVRIKFAPMKRQDASLILPSAPYLKLPDSHLPKKAEVDALLLTILDLEIRARNLYLLHSHYKSASFQWIQDSSHIHALQNNPVWIGKTGKIPKMRVYIFPALDLIVVTPSPDVDPLNPWPTNNIRTWRQPTEPTKRLTDLTFWQQKARAISLVNYLKGLRFKMGVVDATQ